MRHRSTKKEAEYRLRRPLVAQLLEEYPECQACQVFADLDGVTVESRRSTEINEIVRRSAGGSILDEDNLMALCHQCHQRITEYRDGAETLEALGLYRRGDKRSSQEP